MNGSSQIWRRWWAVVVFAAAMAWVESAVVYYLRTMVNRLEPLQPNPLPLIGGLGQVELIRELATLVMLLAVGFLAGRNWPGRLGFAAVAFGAWDIFYYVFLKVICGWPRSLLDVDILFLIPLPWWGPVLAPVSIAVLMILWGTLVNHAQVQSLGEAAGGKWVVLAVAGTVVALYTFMADALTVAGQGTDALRNLLPARFNWPLFLIALCTMALPAITLGRRFWAARNPLPATGQLPE
jgi:hypothetical protein